MQLKAAYVLFTLAHFAIAAPTTDSTSGLSPVNSPRGSPGGSPRGSPRGSPQGHETIRTNAGASPEPSVDTYWRLGAFRPADVPDATGAPRGRRNTIFPLRYGTKVLLYTTIRETQRLITLSASSQVMDSRQRSSHVTRSTLASRQALVPLYWWVPWVRIAHEDIGKTRQRTGKHWEYQMVRMT